MALLNFAYQKRDYGSPIEIFKILSFTIIPVFLIGPLAGVYVDRWNRRRTMYSCDFLRALLVLVVPFFLFYYQNMALAYFLIFLIFCLGRFFIPAKMSIIPELVEKKDLLMANSLVKITGMIAAVLGFGISGALVEKVGAENGFYLDAVSFFVSGTLIFLITKRQAARINLRKVGQELVEVIRKSVMREIKDGILYFAAKKGIGFTAGILFALSSAMGVVFVVLIAFVQNTLGSATKDLGFLIMFLGAGLFSGTVLYGRFGQRLNQYRVIFIALFCTGAIITAFGFGLSYYPSFSLAAILSFALGFLFSPVMIAVNTIIHKVSDSEMMGKVFSSIEIIMHLGFLLFMFISSLLAEKFPQEYILAVVGALISLLGVISFIYQRKISWLD